LFSSAILATLATGLGPGERGLERVLVATAAVHE